MIYYQKIIHLFKHTLMDQPKVSFVQLMLGILFVCRIVSEYILSFNFLRFYLLQLKKKKPCKCQMKLQMDVNTILLVMWSSSLCRIFRSYFSSFLGKDFLVIGFKVIKKFLLIFLVAIFLWNRTYIFSFRLLNNRTTLHYFISLFRKISFITLKKVIR